MQYIWDLCVLFRFYFSLHEAAGDLYNVLLMLIVFVLFVLLALASNLYVVFVGSSPLVVLFVFSLRSM